MAVAASAAMSGVVKAGIHAPGSSSFRVGVSLGEVAGAPKWKVGRIGVGRFVASAEEEGDVVVVVSRRAVMVAGLLASGVGASEARAGVPTYRKYVDRLDGYAFSYPAGWIQVRGAGADIFFRDPVNLDENVLVEMSSPSSSKFSGVEDLGTPEQAAKKVLQQQLTEFMSTRIGVRREANVTATRSRVGDDGRLYYEVEVPAIFIAFLHKLQKPNSAENDTHAFQLASEHLNSKFLLFRSNEGLWC